VISQKEVTIKENSRVFLKITIPEAEVKKEYQNVLTSLCKQAVVKGFRPGKVPPEILVRKYCEEIKGETLHQLINKSLEEAFEGIKEKPLSYSKPEVTSQLNLELDKDFSFEVSYDTYPQIKLANYRGVKVEKPEVSITDEDIQRELKFLQERSSFVKEKVNGSISRGDIVTVDYVELGDNDQPREETRYDGFIFEVGKNSSRYQFEEEILGMKVDEEKVISKTYPSDYSHQELAGKSVRLKVAIRSIKEKIIPELDDEFAQDLSEKYQTLEDLKNDIRQKLEEAKNKRLEELIGDRIIEKIVEKSEIPLPESMILADLYQRWEDFKYNMNTSDEMLEKLLAKDGTSKEELFKKWRPLAEERVKSLIVLKEIAATERIEASEAEIEAEIKKSAAERNLEYDKAKEAYEKMGFISHLRSSLISSKTIKFLIENAQLTKGKEVSYLDLVEGNC